MILSECNRKLRDGVHCAVFCSLCSLLFTVHTLLLNVLSSAHCAIFWSVCSLLVSVLSSAVCAVFCTLCSLLFTVLSYIKYSVGFTSLSNTDMPLPSTI